MRRDVGDRGSLWHPRAETLDRDALAAWQWRKLQAAMQHARRSPFWRSTLPEDVDSLAEFRARTPIVTKQDLVKAQQVDPPFGELAACDPGLGMRRHRTSGTSGNVPYATFDSHRDWAWTVDVWCTALHAFGVRAGQVGTVGFGYGLFMGFWGMQAAMERMGVGVVPSGGMDTRARVRFLLEHEIEVLGTTPTYALRLLETAQEMGVDLARSALRTVVTAAEPRPASLAATFGERFGARVYDAAGMTELGTLFAFECPAKPGDAHIIETAVLEEVIDPDSGREVAYGEPGVRVMTSLGREGLPLFRYWTNDLVVRRQWHECSCGRTWDLYEGGVLGRVDDVRKIRGVPVSPAMIESVVRAFPEVAEFAVHLRRDRGLDTIHLTIELSDDAPAGLPERLADRIKRDIGLRPAVDTAALHTLPRFEAKAARFHDERG